MTADGMSDPAGETNIASGTKQYIRAGWLVSVSSGSTLACGSVAGEVQFISA